MNWFQRARGRRLGSVAIVLVSTMPAARAGTFDIKGVEVTKGESEVALGAAWQHGFPANSDFLRQSYEVGYGYGFLSWFKAGVKLGFEQPDHERLEASYAGVEAQAVAVDPSKGGIGLAWYAGVDFDLQKDGGEVLTVGPLVSFNLAKDVSVTLNPLLQKAFDPSSPGIDFNYAWQVKRTISERVALGLEGYGVVPDLANAPSADLQEHRLGPVLYLSHEHSGNGSSMKLGPAGGGGGKIELEFGLLFGLTKATADTTGRAKLAITW
jgi:hypothetical protein